MSVALIAMLALVVTPGMVGSRNPTHATAPDPDAFHDVLGDLDLGPTTAPDTFDQQAAADAGIAAGDAIADPSMASAQPWLRLELAQPSPEIAAVLKPTPRPSPIVGTSSTGTGWHVSQASWYGTGFFGHHTACGQTYSTTIQGVAHKTLPCGTKVTFRNPKNGMTITVPVIDRGPYVAGRDWDLSYATCHAIEHCWTGSIQWVIP